MSQSFTDLPEDPQELRKIAELMADTVKNQALMIEKLNYQLKGMQKHRFGSKSETAEQLGLKLFEQEVDEALMDEAAEESPAKEAPQKPKREALPKKPASSKPAGRARANKGVWRLRRQAADPERRHD